MTQFSIVCIYGLKGKHQFQKGNTNFYPKGKVRTLTTFPIFQSHQSTLLVKQTFFKVIEILYSTVKHCLNEIFYLKAEHNTSLESYLIRFTQCSTHLNCLVSLCGSSVNSLCKCSNSLTFHYRLDTLTLRKPGLSLAYCSDLLRYSTDWPQS